MSDLTETEVVDRLKTSLRIAGEAAMDLSIASRRGPIYSRLREHLLLIEGSCRQLSAMREDTRWLEIGVAMHKAHDMAGGWLRGYKHPTTGMRVHFSAKTRNPLFVKLSHNLAMMLVGADSLLTRRTGMRGPILPGLPAYERRVGAPVQVLLPAEARTKSGIILPRGAF